MLCLEGGEGLGCGRALGSNAIRRREEEEKGGNVFCGMRILPLLQKQMCVVIKYSERGD